MIRLFLRRDLRSVLYVFDKRTFHFTGLTIGRYGFGFIKFDPRVDRSRRGDE